MAASTVTIPALTNDSGTAAVPVGDGTILNNAWFQTTLGGAINAMFAGAGAYATFTLGGILAVEGFGSHTFSAGGTGGNIIAVRNTTAGTSNYSAVLVGNNSSSTHAYLQAFSSTYTTSGPSVASGALLNCEGAGGLSVSAANAAGTIRFYTGGTTLRGTIGTDGALAMSTTGFGSSFSGSNINGCDLSVYNSASGTAGNASLTLTNDTLTSLSLFAFSSGYTTFNYLVQRGGALVLNGTQYTGGMHYAAKTHTFWEWGGSTKLAILTNSLAADNGLFLPDTFSLHVGAATRVGRATTNSTNAINIYNGTAPVGAAAGLATLYVTAGELRVMDSAGNATLLSPHDDDGLWIYDSKSPQTGKHLTVDMERLVKALDAMLGGGYVHEVNL